MTRFSGGGDIPSPLKQLRESCGLTLDTVAHRTNFSKQYIIRCEQAVYSEISGVLVAYYATITDVNVREIEKQYFAYQRATRIANYGRLVEPWPFDKTPVGNHPFTHWRNMSKLDSAAGVCKYFCVHPAMFHKFENKPHLVKQVPDALLAALLESGYQASTLLDLEVAYEAFLKHISSKVEVIL